MKELIVDAGGTNFRALLETDGRETKRFHADYTQRGFLALLEEGVCQHGPDVVSISFAGQIEDGTIKSSPNIPIAPMNIARYFREKYDVELFIDNDLNCAALAESEYFGVDHTLVVYSGTGLGGAYVSGGKILRGAHNQALEIGHIPYKKTPLLCGCGKSDCIELFASGSGIAKRIKLLGLEDKNELENLIKSEDTRLREIYDDYIDAMGFALGSAITLLNPSLIVLGGGVYNANRERVHHALVESAKKYAMPVSIDSLRFESSRLADAGILGARLLKRL